MKFRDWTRDLPGEVAKQQSDWERRQAALRARMAGLDDAAIGRLVGIRRRRVWAAVEIAEEEAGQPSPAQAWLAAGAEVKELAEEIRRYARGYRHHPPPMRRPFRARSVEVIGDPPVWRLPVPDWVLAQPIVRGFIDLIAKAEKASLHGAWWEEAELLAHAMSGVAKVARVSLIACRHRCRATFLFADGYFSRRVYRMTGEAPWNKVLYDSDRWGEKASCDLAYELGATSALCRLLRLLPLFGDAFLVARLRDQVINVQGKTERETVLKWFARAETDRQCLAQIIERLRSEPLSVSSIARVVCDAGQLGLLICEHEGDQWLLSLPRPPPHRLGCGPGVGPDPAGVACGTAAAAAGATAAAACSSAAPAGGTGTPPALRITSRTPPAASFATT